MKLGIFGGTFDPIHNGHLVTAEHVRVTMGLERVLFIPAGQPWFKASCPVTEARHRLEMVKLAVAHNPKFELSDIEVRREGSTYTIDTLTALREEIGEGVELYVILGTDALNELHRWRAPREVLDMATIVGVARPGADVVDRAALESIRSGASEEIVFVDGPRVDISAASVRQRMADGLQVDGLIPQVVHNYIDRHGLYGRKEQA